MEMDEGCNLALTMGNRSKFTEGFRRLPLQAGCGVVLSAALLFTAQIVAQGSASAAADASAAAIWQPKIHFYAPPNWINDPNGPIFLNGQYQMFFQFNPFGDQWGHMSWGHAVSTDLIHWKQLPVALKEENGIGIFSGSTVEDKENTSGLCGTAGQKTPGCVVAIYTGASQEKQTQNIAYSKDGGSTWTKFSGNPVIDAGLKDFRDPKVFWHGPTESWVMVVALPDQHKVRFYRSKNLREWEMASEFGPAGGIGGVWECPDLFELPIQDGLGKAVYDTYLKRPASRWVLNVNVNPGGPAKGSASQYFVGKFDGFKFVEDHPHSGPHWADWGKDFYASTSFSNTAVGTDGIPERIWIAWMSDWQYADKLPALPGRGEMTVVRRLYLRQPHGPAPTPAQEPLLLVQEPILPGPAHKAYGAMFGAPKFQSIELANAGIAVKKLAGPAYRLRFDLAPGDASESGVRLRRSAANSDGSASEETVVGIEAESGRVFVDRTHSGRVDWSPDFPGRVYAPLKHSQATFTTIEIVVDRNSIEVFAENGETVLTDLIYPSPGSDGISFYSSPTPPGAGPALIRDVELVGLE
jgi:sucrose-6-phosphate hydrolase SacC (GH32 family)